MSKPILFLDMDGVITDLFRGIVESPLGRRYPEITVETLVGRYHDSASDAVHEVYSLTEDEFWTTFNSVEFWANLPPFPWLPELVATAEGGRYEDVFILTAPSVRAPASATGKLLWIERHLPRYLTEKRVLIVNRKELLAAPYRLLLDDSLSKATRFAEHGGLSLLFPQPYNYKPYYKRMPSRVMRPNNYQEVIECLKAPSS